MRAATINRMEHETERQAWVDETVGRLLAKGLRNGGARRAVIELLGEQSCCLTAQEIFDGLRASGRRVGIAGRRKDSCLHRRI